MYSGKMEENILNTYNAQNNFTRIRKKKKNSKLLMPTFLKNAIREEGGMPGFSADAFFTLTLSDPSDSLASSNALKITFVWDES